MRFCLSEEQIALKDGVARLLADTCRADRLPRRAVEGEAVAERVLSGPLFGMGLGGLLIPEEHGGLGLGLIDAALVSQSLGYEAAPWPFLGHALATLAIARGGSPAQQAEWLPRLASGEARASFAFCEPDGGWTPDDWRLPLSGGTLTGDKQFVVGAAEADVLVVGVEGRGLALAEASAATCRPQRGLDGTRPLSVVSFRQAAAERLPGADPDAQFDALLVLLAADAHGCVRRCIDMTVDYALTRRQFGRPIGSFQGLKHQLANATADVVPTEAMVWYAAIAGSPGAGAVAAAQAKAHVTDRAVESARLSVEMHGGIGYTWDYDLHIWLKRAMFDFAYAGTPALHRARAMALAERTAGTSAIAELF